LALGLSACGSANDDGDSGSAATQDEPVAATTADENSGTPKEQVVAALEGFRKDFIAGDGKSFCNRLTPAGRQDAIEFSRQINRGPTCEAMVRETAKMTRESGASQPKMKIASVKIDGNKATAIVRAAGRSTTFKLVNRDGQWKIPDPGFSKALQNTAG
jgi:hypothetical protein